MQLPEGRLPSFICSYLRLKQTWDSYRPSHFTLWKKANKCISLQFKKIVFWNQRLVAVVVMFIMSSFLGVTVSLCCRERPSTLGGGRTIKGCVEARGKCYVTMQDPKGPIDGTQSKDEDQMDQADLRLPERGPHLFCYLWFLIICVFRCFIQHQVQHFLNINVLKLKLSSACKCSGFKFQLLAVMQQ